MLLIEVLSYALLFLYIHPLKFNGPILRRKHLLESLVDKLHLTFYH